MPSTKRQTRSTRLDRAKKSWSRATATVPAAVVRPMQRRVRTSEKRGEVCSFGKEILLRPRKPCLSVNERKVKCCSIEPPRT
jgi:hypothetical protein